MYILYGSLATYFGINDIITISQNIGYIKNHIINANPPRGGIGRREAAPDCGAAARGLGPGRIIG